MTNLLNEITIKYQENVELVRCLILFFENRNSFSLQCNELSKSHLVAYISILSERYAGDKKCSADVLFDVKYIFKNMVAKSKLIIENNVVNEILEILALTIFMSEERDQSIDIIDKFMRDFSFTDNETGAFQLSVAELIYGIYPELFSHAIQTLIVNSMFSEMPLVQTRSLKLVRHMIVADNRAAFVDNIIDEIEKRKTTQRLQCLTILCFLIDCIGFGKRIISKSSFWLYLQQEMLLTDRSVHKYAFYVIRKIVECYDLEDVLSGPEIRKQWENFFLIQETLDEKQSHLILPVLDLLPTTKSLPMNWHYVLIVQLLHHENTLVLQNGLIYCIKNVELDLGSIKGGDYLGNKLISSLLTGLNNTFLYSKYDFHVAALNNFFKPIFGVVFEELSTINWKPVPMYYIVVSIIDLILEQNREKCDQIAEMLIRLLRLVNKIPNLHIRNGIHLNIHRTIVNISGNIGVERFIQLAIVTRAPPMNIFHLLEFDNLSLDDYITVINHKDLSDDIKRTFLRRLEITNEDLLYILKLMKMNESTSFQIFEVLSPYHFYELSIWLSNALLDVSENLSMSLSMYGVLYNINECKHNMEIIKVILPRENFFESLNVALTVPAVINNLCIVDCITTLCLSYESDEHTSRLLDKFIECGTVETILATLNMLKIKPQFIDEANLTQIMKCVKDLEHFAVTNQFLDTLKISPITQKRRHTFYELLIQMAFNQAQLLAVIVDQFLQENDEFLANSSKHIQKLLTYGVALKGDQRVEHDLCQLLHRNELEWVECSYIRCQLLLKLINGFPPNKRNNSFIEDLTNHLFRLSSELNASKPRYYADSQTHRTKLRLVQALAALLCRTYAWDMRLKTSLLTENNQPNITFILELMIARTIDPNHLPLLLAEAKSNSARQSIFVIMYYVCARLNNCEWGAKYIENILIYTMGQHFNTRLFAQVAIVKIIEKFNMNKYKSVLDQIMHSFDQGNARQISEKFLNDFRFTCIDCEDLLNPIYFLCEIPRVTHMASDELIPARLLKLGDKIENKLIFKDPFHVNVNMCGTHNENTVDSAKNNVQKKIIPMKNIFPNANLLETLPYHSINMKGHNREGLIVVASLVSRAANLGGLSRTCEIFGVQQLILNSLKHIENKEFQSLSMTSEKWLNIGEMKSFQLLEYLVLMKSKGYYIIGAEQTAVGKKLTDLKFPKNHEKDGVPANLLSVLDVAVEIPQFGVVRSLNVHVSGAIFVWEYAKQHNF